MIGWWICGRKLKIDGARAACYPGIVSLEDRATVGTDPSANDSDGCDTRTNENPPTAPSCDRWAGFVFWVSTDIGLVGTAVPFYQIIGRISMG